MDSSLLQRDQGLQMTQFSSALRDIFGAQAAAGGSS
jgi:hypothetical protein